MGTTPAALEAVRWGSHAALGVLWAGAFLAVWSLSNCAPILLLQALPRNTRRSLAWCCAGHNVRAIALAVQLLLLAMPHSIAAKTWQIKPVEQPRGRDILYSLGLLTGAKAHMGLLRGLPQTWRTCGRSSGSPAGRAASRPARRRWGRRARACWPGRGCRCRAGAARRCRRRSACPPAPAKAN